jgi:hypothetical protein
MAECDSFFERCPTRGKEAAAKWQKCRQRFEVFLASQVTDDKLKPFVNAEANKARCLKTSI